MSSSIIAPHPCLAAVLLVCQTRSGSGPQLVFHWPPHPSQKLDHSLSFSDDQNSIDSDDDSEQWSDDEFDNQIYGDGSHASDPNGSSDRPSSGWTIQKRAPSFDNQMRRVGSVFGLEEDGLVGLLAPDRTWHKRKFELSINDLTFVGCPVFARSDGLWQRRKKAHHSKHRSSSPDFGHSTEDENVVSQEEPTTEATQDPKVQIKSELTMFHAVFVMKPPPLEHAHRIKDMYDNVIKKFSRALRWAQVHHDYVWQQTDLLSSKRQQLAMEPEYSSSGVAQELAKTSSLAKALVTIFNAISASKIASVVLTSGLSLSLQIPPVTSTAYLPSLTEPPIPPGLWLTTATESTSDQYESDKHNAMSAVDLAKSYTLLLKSPPHRIAKDAQMASDPRAAELPKFVAALRPTKSFWKLSNAYHIPIPRIHLIAKHLIEWRRAIAIPPLHQRDTYIVSPNADFSKIREACKSYESQFPASLPSLPKLLSVLSGIPQPFGTLIPSPDHKDIYMLLLAWLLRNGWVTQLRTFAYVRVDTNVKQATADGERGSKTSISQSFNSNSDGPQLLDDNAHVERPSFVSRQSSDGRQSLRDVTNLKGASLIKSPPRASPEESRWLNYIRDNMLEDDGIFSHLSATEREKLHRFWPVFSKHFDGVTALETISLRDSLKRKVVWDLLGRMGLCFDGGVENEDGNNNTILVTIRHW